MVDIFFTPQKVYDGYPAKTARMAVLSSIFGPCPKHAIICKRTLALLFQWREWLDLLHQTGSPLIPDAAKLQSLRNCFPAFAICDPVSLRQKCYWDSVCPFCYARRVAEIYQRIHAACADDYNAAVSFRHLVERRLTRRTSFENEAHMVEQIRFVTAGRKIMSDRFSALGGYGIVHVVPTKNYPHLWTVTVRQLFLVAAGERIEPSQPDEKLFVHARFDRKTVSHAVARVCRYPRGLLKAPIERMRFWLEVKRRHRLRCSGLLGVFRRNSQEDD
jgi:hypothetical protein